jgi:hypothetical protein
MAQPNGSAPAAAQRPSRRRLWIALAVLGGVLYVAFQALSGAAALYLSSPALFQNNQNRASVAPAGWHNVTPSGKATNPSYAVSADVPGLILACGATLSTSLSSFGKWNLRLQRSDDGGAHWRNLGAPFLKGNSACAVTPITGDKSTFFAYGRDLSNSSQTPIWVTHDSGETWRQAFTAQGELGEYDAMGELVTSVLRDGLMYTMHGDVENAEFSSSADDGATWKPLLHEDNSSTPQKHVLSVAPDYSQAHAWFRLAYPDAGGLTLERSRDDGATWTVIEQYPRQGATPFKLATSASQPNQLCAYDTEDDSPDPNAPPIGDTTIFSSGDGGVTWRQATLPVRDGYAGPVRSGVNGCYLVFDELTKDGDYTAPHNALVWRLPQNATTAEQVALAVNYSLEPGALIRDNFSVIPPSSGMDERVVIIATRDARSWLDFFGGNTSDLTTPQLLWTPAT